MGAEDRGWGPGWPNCQYGQIENVSVAGVDFPGGIHDGPVQKVLASLIREFDQEVESLVDGWCWGFSCRQIRSTGVSSNHAWGLAVDLNAPNHPYGVEGTFSKADERKCYDIAERHGCRWGGEYADEMHFEFMGTPDDARRIADGGLAGNVDSSPASSRGKWQKRVDAEPGTREIEQWAVGSDVGFVQRFLGIEDDDYFGEVTEREVVDYQEMREIDADGIVGPVTWDNMLQGDDGENNGANVGRDKSHQKDKSNRRTVDFSNVRREAQSGGHNMLWGVKHVQHALNMAGGILAGGQIDEDGYYGPATIDLYGHWQWFLGWRGAEADGIPGWPSMNDLVQRTGYFKLHR